MDFEKMDMPAFGVAGNFTGHLEQAGEARDFANVKTAEAKAPKAIFPTFIPGDSKQVPEFLHTFPFCDDKILFPKDEEKLQIEPECAVFCSVKWEGEKMTSIEPNFFAASNDCSIRKEGAKKISEKKNWGACTKGVSANRIPIDVFTTEGILNGYRIASFLVRDGQIYDYGEDSAVRDYSYVYEKLNQWMIDRFNTQANEGPAEDIHAYLLEAGKPENIMVSIGATRYTDFGEHNFLKGGDVTVVAVYPENKFNHENIKKMVSEKDFSSKEISFLCQIVVQ